MKPFKTIKLLLSTLLLFVLSFNANAELPDNALQMQEHLNILGYKTTIPDNNSAIIAVNNNEKFLLMKTDKGFGITRLFAFKNNIKKDIKFYKFLNKLNSYDLIKATELDGDFLSFTMMSLNKYNREDFTQIVNKFNEMNSAILKLHKKEMSEYVK